MSDCGGCHGGSNATTIELRFEPASPEPGETVMLTLTISGDNASSAGFFLEAPEAGELQAVSGQPTNITSSGATHSSPIGANGGSAQVQMQWLAPDSAGGTLFEVAAVAANGNGSNSGDSATRAQFGLVWGCGDGITLYKDNDGDGIGAETFGKAPGCEAHDNWVETDGDCNENDSDIHPGATEICNEKDDDCNGETDEGTTPRRVYEDNDGDGFGAIVGQPLEACKLPSGYADNNDDCDDVTFETHPGALEVCNNLDDNCDGRNDENVRPRCGTGWCERLAPLCDPDSCVPGDPTPEQCNALDDDCDGETDEDVTCPAGSSCRNAACQDDSAPSSSAAAPDDSSEPAPSNSAAGNPIPVASNTATAPTASNGPSDSPPTQPSVLPDPESAESGSTPETGSADDPTASDAGYSPVTMDPTTGSLATESGCSVGTRSRPSALAALLTLGLWLLAGRRRRAFNSQR